MKGWASVGEVAAQAWAWVRRRLRPASALPLGKRGEKAAESFLRRLGYRIVERSARHRIGEIDLIAVDCRTIVFVEVKTRSTDFAGHPAEAVTPEKQRRLTRLALGYLKRHGLLEYPARFDIVAIAWPADSSKPRVEHLRGAFESIGRDSPFS